MNGFPGETITLSELVRSEEQGLNVNRLLFAKFLVMTKRINEDHPVRLRSSAPEALHLESEEPTEAQPARPQTPVEQGA